MHPFARAHRRTAARPVKPVRRPRLRLEEFESRLTPATLVSPTTVTFQDMDGDNVTIKLSKPLLTSIAVANNVLKFDTGNVLASSGNGIKQQLTQVLLGQLGASANGIGLTIVASRDLVDGGNGINGGDGFVNVGQIDAATGTALDLGAVVVDGDLGSIDAGDTTTATPGLGSLTVLSLGRFGITTGSPDLQSDINGKLGTLRVKSDIAGALVIVTGGADGKIGTIFVSGSLIGASAANSGTILSTGDMGAVRVNGDLVGAGGNESGEIRTSGKITGGLINGVFVGVTVGGSVIGGAGMQSGRIRANGDLPAIRIGRDLLGGSNSAAGQIQSVGGTIASVTVGGSLVGGSGLETGSLVSGSNIGPVRINGSMEGGAGVHSGGINLDTQGNSTSVTIGGSIRSGSGALSGCICVNGVLGPVKVLGSLVGTVARPVVISGLGHLVLPATATTDVGIKSLTVGGRVEFAQILAGYQTDSSTVLTPANADAQIGAVVVGGDWIASSIGAGVIDGGNGFGNSGDAKITDPNDAPNIISKIGSINIAGEVMGTVGGADHFGFVAEQISSLMVGGQTIALTANKDVVNVGTTGDVALQEI